MYSEKPDAARLLSLITDTFYALEHIHQQQVVHWDLKCDNILVSASGVPKIIDFGNAKLLDVERENDLTVATSKGKYPDLAILQPVDSGLDDSRRFRIELPDRSWNNPFLDIWMLAQEWNRCLKFSPKYLEGKSDLSDGHRDEVIRAAKGGGSSASLEIWDSARIIFDRVLATFSGPGRPAAIKSDSSFNAEVAYYQDATAVLEEISRMLPPFGAARSVPELLVTLDEIIRLPVTGNSVFTPRVAALIDSGIIQPTKLHHQLGLVKEVFPGATHTRFEHLLGTIATVAYYIRSLYLNTGNAFWRVSARANDVRAVLLAAILHDVGHLAYGHFLEEMDDLMGDRKHTLR